ncbi:MAG: hypothetical protein JXR63_02540 [Spirochaetales bacterium]|nr:hypothetical protein [Spirochaetales bacterium]
MKDKFIITLLLLLFATSYATNRIEWEPVPNAYSYRIVIQNSAGEVVLEQETQNSYLEVILLPGIYRYQITVLNRFLKPAAQTEWIRLEVIIGKPPIIIFSEADLYYVGEDEIEFLLSIYDFESGGKVFIQNERNSAEADIISSEGNDYLCRFNTKGFKSGIYDIYVENPSGKSDILTGGLEFVRKSLPIILKINPKRVYEQEIIPLFSIKGNGFEKGAKVEITGKNGTVLVSNINIVSKKELNFWADFKEAKSGYYKIRIINPSGRDCSKILFRVLSLEKKELDPERNISSSVNLVFRWPFFYGIFPMDSIDQPSIITSAGFIFETDFGGKIPLLSQLGYAFSVEYNGHGVIKLGEGEEMPDQSHYLFIGNEFFYNTKFISMFNFHFRFGGGVFLQWDRYVSGEENTFIMDTGGFLSVSAGVVINPHKNVVLRPLIVLRPFFSSNGAYFQSSFVLDIGYRF